MQDVTYLILYSLVGGLFSILVAFIIAWQFRKKTALLPILTSFAAAVMIGFVFLDLIPESLEGAAEPKNIMMAALLSFVILFLIESITGYHGHGHDEHMPVEKCESTAWFVSIGDTLHNFVDGLAIATAYIVDPGLALGTALIVAAHEIPQELSDFGVMLKCGWSVKKAAMANIVSSFATLVGALGLYYFRSDVEPISPYLLALAVGMFTYIAAADLIPQIHQTFERRNYKPLVAFLAGLVLVIVLT